VATETSTSSRLGRQDPYDVTSFLYVAALVGFFGVWVLFVLLRLGKVFLETVLKRLSLTNAAKQHKQDEVDRQRIRKYTAALLRHPEVSESLNWFHED